LVRFGGPPSMCEKAGAGRAGGIVRDGENKGADRPGTVSGEGRSIGGEALVPVGSETGK
jgi:hypothetical protein